MSSVAFKKRSRLAVQRRRQSSSGAGSSSSDSDKEAVVFRDKKAKQNPMVQSTNAKRLPRARAASSSSDEADGDTRREAETDITVAYESTARDKVGPSDMGATATLEIDTEVEKDAQTQFERAQEKIKESRGKADDKTYKGMAAYGNFYEKKDTAAGKASSGFVRKGPIRAPNFVRQSVRWDYAPDICKDFKETGFCTFGDSCKFMHDRTDYKHGWELEREWAEGRYGASDADPHKYEVSDEEDHLPFKCLICRESFTSPIVTKCKHYFCEKCALEQFAKTPKCYACDKPTGGVFNPAKEILERMAGETSKKKRRRQQQKDENGGYSFSDSSDDDKKSKEKKKSKANDGGDDDDDVDDIVEDTPMERLPSDPSDNDSGEGEGGDKSEAGSAKGDDDDD